MRHDVKNTYHCDCRDPEGHAQWLELLKEIERYEIATTALLGATKEDETNLARLALYGALMKTRERKVTG